MTTAIISARVFDSERVRREATVLVDGTRIAAVGGEPPARADIAPAGR